MVPSFKRLRIMSLLYYFTSMVPKPNIMASTTFFGQCFLYLDIHKNLPGSDIHTGCIYGVAGLENSLMRDDK
jgi:hypothetical protein